MKTKQFCSWMAVGALVLAAASCQENESFDLQTEVDMTDVYGTGSKIVTLTLNAESVLGTRAGANADSYSHISDGSNVNALLFEVYDLGTGESTDEATPSSSSTLVGLTTLDVTHESFPMTIKLAIEEDHTYKAAFWAQHATKGPTTDYAPFTISDLTEVKVNYNAAKNNDDLRDAFCANVEITSGTPDVSVVLHRPFAQLNVGTTGADYKNYMSGNIYPNKTIIYSKMVVKGVLDQINVATDEVSLSEENSENGQNKTMEATFAYNVIPAFKNYSSFDDFSNFLTDGQPNDGEAQDGYVTWDEGVSTNEEFLYVNLNNPGTPDSELQGYKVKYPTYNSKAEEGKKYLTETFKYLSMAYVLVPSDVKVDHSSWYGDNEGNKYDTYKSATLGAVEVYFANDTEKDGQKYFTVKNVPVHRNWRTNLLGGIWEPDDDDNPKDPDDPSSVFSNVKIAIQLCPIYFGEYNGKYNPSENNGYTGINAGYFPTGDNDLHEENKSSTE